MSDTMSEQSARVAAQSATRQRADSPGVRIPPPVYYAAVFLIGLFLQARLPLPYFPQPYALVLGLVALLPGVALAAVSVITMLRGKGTLNTNAASAQLVTTGIYRVSRNPMYVSNALIYGGLASLFSVTWALVFLPLLIILTQVVVILPEERFLTRHFGDEYRAYKSRVRRWL
ncbi:MAG TPA: isoprenylcysteine carboxylmethyltransferase family protein [Ktedonobacterales bacterium]|nr:isoprenylcysteine carboxylmethyltransferase family protein [Ktedonobacterales bacterium]